MEKLHDVIWNPENDDRMSKVDKTFMNQDKKAHEILSNKDWRSLTNEDFLYLSALAEQAEKP